MDTGVPKIEECVDSINSRAVRKIRKRKPGTEIRKRKSDTGSRKLSEKHQSSGSDQYWPTSNYTEKEYAIWERQIDSVTKITRVRIGHMAQI